MNKFIKSMGSSVTAFFKEEEGAQVIEYALIIAVVSIGLIALFDTVDFSGWINRVNVLLVPTA